MKKALLSLALITCCAALVFGWQRWFRMPQRFPFFREADAATWRTFGGDWHLQDGIYTDRADGRGDKLVGGPASQGNYEFSADLRFDTAAEDPIFGDAGILLRVQEPAVGVDAMRGYYTGLRLDDHVLLIGHMAFGFRELATAPFPHELRPGRWYRITFSAQGCTFHARAEDTITKEAAELSYVEQTCDPLRGQIGLRSYYAKASWRDPQVRVLP